MEALAVFFCLAITLHNIEEAIWLPQYCARFKVSKSCDTK